MLFFDFIIDVIVWFSDVAPIKPELDCIALLLTLFDKRPTGMDPPMRSPE